MKKSNNTIWLVLYTLIVGSCALSIILLPEARKFAPLVVIMGVVLAVCWGIFIYNRVRAVRKSSDADVDASRRPEGTMIDQRQVDGVATQIARRNAQIARQSVPNDNENVQIARQSGGYDKECALRLFEPGAREILFVIEAEWGKFSKHIDFAEGKYYYVCDTVARYQTLGMWTQNDEERVQHEISYEQALTYAATAEERALLEEVEGSRREYGRESCCDGSKAEC